MIDHTGGPSPASKPDWEVVDPRGAELIPGNSFLERLGAGLRWGEGPVYFADLDCVLFSDIPNNRMMRWSDGAGLSVFRTPSNNSNGNTRDLQGRLLTCEHRTRRVTRTEVDGSVTVLADHHAGGRLNSPNDIVVKSDGSVWFTDPPYGIEIDFEGGRAAREQERNFVFRLDPEDGELEPMIDDMDQPNGLAFSPDESVLYVSDTGHGDGPAAPPHIRAYDIGDDGRPHSGRVFATLDGDPSDGFRLDSDGNVWTSGGKGVDCFAADGSLLLRIHVPERVANVVFGGRQRNRLFITANTSFYSIYTNVSGAQRP